MSEYPLRAFTLFSLNPTTQSGGKIVADQEPKEKTTKLESVQQVRSIEEFEESWKVPAVKPISPFWGVLLGLVAICVLATHSVIQLNSSAPPRPESTSYSWENYTEGSLGTQVVRVNQYKIFPEDQRILLTGNFSTSENEQTVWYPLTAPEGSDQVCITHQNAALHLDAVLTHQFDLEIAYYPGTTGRLSIKQLGAEPALSWEMKWAPEGQSLTCGEETGNVSSGSRDNDEGIFP